MQQISFKIKSGNGEIGHNEQLCILPMLSSLFYDHCLKYLNILTLSNLQTRYDASAADDSRKLCEKRRNCSKQAICPFATKFSTLFNKFTSTDRGFPHYCSNVFKVVCCRFVESGLNNRTVCCRFVESGLNNRTVCCRFVVCGML